MQDLENLEQQTKDIEFEITDLDQSDHIGGNITSWSASKLLAWQGLSPRRRGFRLASALGVLLLLAMLFSLNTGAFSHPRSVLHPPAAASLATPLFPQQDGIACLADAAWSPDSQFIAVLGYTQDCPQDEYVPGIVNLYNAHSHHVIKQLHPDAAIKRVLNGPTASAGRPFGPQPPVGGSDAPPLVLYYIHVLWSPDGQRLAFTFELALRQPLLHGVVVMKSDDTDAQVLLQYQSATAPLYAEWDTQRGTSAAFRPSPAAPSFAPAPPALAYHWGTGGTLVPETLLTDNQVPVVPQPGPVGNPGGDTSFTIWQPGLAHVISLGGSFRASAWSTDFAAWSPDGRYLVDGLGLLGLLQPSGRLFPNYKAFAASRMMQAPLLPAHDATFLQVIQDATAMAWSPNGRLLAAYTARNIVDLYDCVNGRKLASLFLHTSSAAPSAGSIAMRWSPDGSRLLLSSVPWGLVSLWSPENLP
jgi:WD40-like Beta Propeller Repeat